MLLEQKMQEEIEGGLADNKTLENIFKKYPNIDQDKIKKEYEMGIEVEKKEHGDNAKEIALDHLVERWDYYTMMKIAEKSKVNPNGTGFVVNEERKMDNIIPEDEEINTEDFQRNIENSDKIRDILTHEELADLCKYVELVYEYPVAEKHDEHADSTSTDYSYYIGEIKEDVAIIKKQIILKAGFYSIEKVKNPEPKIDPIVYTGSYETVEECIERLVNILIDLENKGSGTTVTLKETIKDFDER